MATTEITTGLDTGTAVRGSICPGQRVLLALGANVPGPWGEPAVTLARAALELDRAGVRILQASPLYDTAPLGSVRQPRYANVVLLGETHLGPAALLRLAKRLERAAGRRLGPHWGPRPLDIDLLDFGGRRLGWPRRQPAEGRRARGRLVLPHPELHRRAFVLVPLLEVAPAWAHPVLRIPARTLLARLGGGAGRSVGQALDFKALACDKTVK